MRTISLLFVIVIVAASAAWADFEAITLKNAGLARVVSGVSNILKTTDINVGDAKLLGQPEMEFMIELTYKGEPVNLVPTDFDIKALDRVTKGPEQYVSAELHSHYPGLPLIIYVDYIRDPKATYQQKAITITPCKEAKGAIIKRVTLDYVLFKKTLMPISVSEAGFGNEAKSSFAMIEPKSGKGVCFDADSGKIKLTGTHTLSIYEDANAQAETGWQTGRASIGAVSGAPEAAFHAYRQLLLETHYLKLASDAKMGALKKRFVSCFAACQYLPPSIDGQIDYEGHIADNKGFIFLFNRGSEAAKAVLPITDAGLKLSGEVTLSDWTSLDKSTPIGVRKLDDKIELDVDAHGYRIVGVNVE